MQLSHGSWLLCVVTSSLPAPDDGLPMLHLLSPSVLHTAELTKSATVAYEWVKRELERHQHAGNDKLTGRYLRLLQYFNASVFNTKTDQRA